jgi:D-alanine-D-alanine ligase
LNVFFEGGEFEARLRSCEVGVLYGGSSSEAEVSRRSGQAVCSALEDASKNGRGPRSIRGIELGIDQRWGTKSGSQRLSEFLNELEGVDICFLALHGGDGENGCIQAVLEAQGMPFTGSNLHAASASMDKWVSRLIAEQAGLRLADGQLVSRTSWNQSGHATFLDLLNRSPAGVCVKPRRGGSSVGVIHGHAPAEVANAVLAILESGDDALIETWHVGVEVACGVLGNSWLSPQALMPVEIRPHEGRFFDYEEKYTDSGAAEFCPPQSLDARVCESIQAPALDIHRALVCGGYSRSDFMVPQEGEQFGQPVFLELNSLPGLTPRSLLPLEAAEAGLDFTDLCLGILRAGFQMSEQPN